MLFCKYFFKYICKYGGTPQILKGGVGVALPPRIFFPKLTSVLATLRKRIVRYPKSDSMLVNADVLGVSEIG